LRKLTSTNFENQQILHSWCGAAFTLSMLNGRWKLSIITQIAAGTSHFSALKRNIPAITDRVLALQLKEMDEAGLLLKTAVAENRRLFEYTLSEAGSTLIPIIKEMEAWSKINGKQSF